MYTTLQVNYTTGILYYRYTVLQVHCTAGTLYLHQRQVVVGQVQVQQRGAGPQDRLGLVVSRVSVCLAHTEHYIYCTLNTVQTI